MSLKFGCGVHVVEARFNRRLYPEPDWDVGNNNKKLTIDLFETSLGKVLINLDGAINYFQVFKHRYKIDDLHTRRLNNEEEI